MGREANLEKPPRDAHLRVVVGALGKGTYSHGRGEGVREVGEPPAPDQLLTLDRPTGKLEARPSSKIRTYHSFVLPRKLRNSARTLRSSKHPLIADVTVRAPGFFTPRISTQRWRASMTTIAPRG